MDRDRRSDALRILVVEDQRAEALHLQMLLADWGYVVVGSAASVEAALETVDRHEIDLAIVDLKLGRTGFGGDVIEYLERHHGVRSLVVSGCIDAASRDAIATFGIAGVLTKPFRDADLRAMLDRFTDEHACDLA